jgi:hypothetical protein
MNADFYGLAPHLHGIFHTFPHPLLPDLPIVAGNLWESTGERVFYLWVGLNMPPSRSTENAVKSTR